MDWDARLNPPVVPDIWQTEAAHIALDSGIESGRSVILFPDNDSPSPLPSSFWQRLVNELNAQGRKVFVNTFGIKDHRNIVHPREEIFEGAHPIEVQARHAIPLVEMAGKFISQPNGITTMVLGTKVRCQSSILLAKSSPNYTSMINGADAGPHGYLQTSWRAVGVADTAPAEYVIDLESPELNAVIRAIATDDHSLCLNAP